MFFDANKQEHRRLTPEFLESAHKRWVILSQATDNEHAGELRVFPDLFEVPVKAAKTFERFANGPVAGKVIDAAARFTAPPAEAEVLTPADPAEHLTAAREATAQAYLPQSPDTVPQTAVAEAPVSPQPIVDPADPMGTLVVPHPEENERVQRIAEAQRAAEEAYGPAA